MKRKSNIDADLKALENAVSGAFTRSLRNIVRDTFNNYIMENSPVFTGAYKSNHQILVDGTPEEPPNISTSSDRKEAKLAGNLKAGPRGVPVGDFQFLIEEAKEQAEYAIDTISSKTTKVVSLTNSSPYADLVEDVHKYMVYTEASEYIKARLASIKGGRR